MRVSDARVVTVTMYLPTHYEATHIRSREWLVSALFSRSAMQAVVSTTLCTCSCSQSSRLGRCRVPNGQCWRAPGVGEVTFGPDGSLVSLDSQESGPIFSPLTAGRRSQAMSNAVTTLHPPEMASFIKSRKITILRLTRGTSGGFLQDLVKYFMDEYKETVAFGSLDQSEAFHPGWAMKHVRGVFAGQAVAPDEAPNGYYLFVNGKAVGFHQGRVIGDKTDGPVYAAGALLALLTQSWEPLSDSIKLLDKKAAEGVAALFERVLENELPSLDGHSGTGKREDPRDPYGVLGLSNTATDAEVKAAYLLQLELNHPDKVAHLSKEIQQLALERTKAITQARGKIMDERRMQPRQH